MTAATAAAAVLTAERRTLHGDWESGWDRMVGRALALGRRQPFGETPPAFLDHRFAQGAVSAGEYRRRRDVLGGAAVSTPTRPSPRRRPEGATG